MDITVIFEYFSHIVSAITLLTLLSSGILGLYKIIIPYYRRKKERRKFIDNFILELGVEAPVIIKNNLKKLTVALEHLDSKVLILTQRSKIGIYLCDENGRCIWVNDPLAEMFEMDKQDMYGYGWLQNIIDKKEAYNHWRWAVENNSPYNDTYQVETSKGIKKYISEAYKHLSEDGKTAIFYIGFVEELNG